jgi:hypothetical protein
LAYIKERERERERVCVSEQSDIKKEIMAVQIWPKKEGFLNENKSTFLYLSSVCIYEGKCVYAVIDFREQTDMAGCIACEITH